RIRATEACVSEGIDLIETQSQLLRFGNRRENREHTYAIRDEIPCVLRPHDALADHAGQERFELIEDLRLRGIGLNEFDQMHVARRIEKVHAAETRFEFVRKTLRQLRD